MTSVIPARRRAEEFAGLVDAGAAGGSRYSDLLDLVVDLRSMPVPDPRPEHVTELRARLMAEADEALAAVDQRLTLPAHSRTRRDRRVAVAATAIVALGATSGVAVAAQDALPGDTLYPVKRAIESARTTLQTDDSARAEQLLDNASGRLDEASELADSPETVESQMPETLDSFVSQAREASDLLLAEYAETGDPQGIERLRSFSAVSMDKLAALDALVPPAIRDDLNAAALALAQIDSLAAEACPACGGGITELPSMFLAAGGPKPATPPAQPTPVAQPDQALDKAAVDELLGELAAVQRDDSDSTSGDTDDSPAATEDAPDAVTEEEPGRPVRRLAEDLLGGGDGEEDPGAVEQLLEGPLLGPVTGEGGLLNP